MRPREFDGEVVQVRLRLMGELLDDLDGAGEITPEQLRADRLLRHAVERILSQLVDLAVSINGHVSVTLAGRAPQDYRSSFALAAKVGLLDPALVVRLQPSVGLRNVLAHEYVEVDLERVAEASALALSDYREYVRHASAWLRTTGDAR